MIRVLVCLKLLLKLVPVCHVIISITSISSQDSHFLPCLKQVYLYLLWAQELYTKPPGDPAGRGSRAWSRARWSVRGLQWHSYEFERDGPLMKGLTDAQPCTFDSAARRGRMDGLRWRRKRDVRAGVVLESRYHCLNQMNISEVPLIN